MRARWIVLLFLITQPVARASQAQIPVQIPGSAQYDLVAKANARPYRLFVSLPEGYAHADTIRYSVLYVLDGNALFPMAVGAYRFLHILGEAPPLIVVAVGYQVDYFRETVALRWTDLTPSRNREHDSTYAPIIASFLPGKKPIPLTSGGGDGFIEALRSDIIPFIDSLYNTDGDRGIIGHSLGGLLTAHALLSAPDAFRRYGILSPAAWWDNGQVFRSEAAVARSRRSLPARVYVAVGDREGKVMVSGADSLWRVLERRQYAGLEISGEKLDDETHVSSAPGAIATAIRRLYADRRKN